MNATLTFTGSEPKRVGLLAGKGRFPIAFARAARAQGLFVHCVGIIGLVSEELESLCDRFDAVPLGRLGKTIRLFRRSRIKHVVLAGKIEKTVMFEPFHLIRNLPDWRMLHMLWRVSRRDKKDDTLLLAVVDEFERDHIKIESALDFCPELLVKHGFLTRRKPSQSQWRDIRFGWDIAKEMGRLDIGQTIIVNDCAVMAVEAIEGTDAAIRRAGQLCKRGGFTVIKVAKPQQDRRFDVPTIGVETLHSMQESGGRVLAIESEQTIVLDQPEVVELADRLGIAIVAINSEELKLRMAS